MPTTLSDRGREAEESGAPHAWWAGVLAAALDGIGRGRAGEFHADVESYAAEVHDDYRAWASWRAEHGPLLGYGAAGYFGGPPASSDRGELPGLATQ